MYSLNQLGQAVFRLCFLKCKYGEHGAPWRLALTESYCEDVLRQAKYESNCHILGTRQLFIPFILFILDKFMLIYRRDWRLSSGIFLLYSLQATPIFLRKHTQAQLNGCHFCCLLSAIEWHEDENWHSSLCNATGFVNLWNHNQAETGSQEPSNERGRWHICPWRASLVGRKQVMTKERMSPCIFHSYHRHPRLVVSLWA